MSLSMSRIFLYGSMIAILAIGAWYYVQGERAPDAILPLVVLLLGLLSLGYAEKARVEGDIGAGTGRIRRERSPRGFRIALYGTYLVTGALMVWAIFLAVA